MKEELTLTEISRLYGYTINAAKKWQERGMPFNTALLNKSDFG